MGGMIPGAKPSYIVKSRDYLQREILTARGRRRVRGRGPWVGLAYKPTLEAAREVFDRLSGRGLTEYAIFHKGKRIHG